MPVRVPKYRLHRGSGQALIEIDGRRLYLGKYDSPESHQNYRRLVVELLAPTPPSPPPALGERLQLHRLVLHYYRFAKAYYVKNGRCTDEVAGVRVALRRLRKLYGNTLADEFGREHPPLGKLLAG